MARDDLPSFPTPSEAFARSDLGNIPPPPQQRYGRGQYSQSPPTSQPAIDSYRNQPQPQPQFQNQQRAQSPMYRDQQPKQRQKPAPQLQQQQYGSNYNRNPYASQPPYAHQNSSQVSGYQQSNQSQNYNASSTSVRSRREKPAAQPQGQYYQQQPNQQPSQQPPQSQGYQQPSQQYQQQRHSPQHHSPQHQHQAPYNYQSNHSQSSHHNQPYQQQSHSQGHQTQQHSYQNNYQQQHQQPPPQPQQQQQYNNYPPNPTPINTAPLQGRKTAPQQIPHNNMQSPYGDSPSPYSELVSPGGAAPGPGSAGHPRSAPKPRGQDLRQIFDGVDRDKNGFLTEAELSSALVNGDYTKFHPNTVRMMLRMFDRNHDGALYFDEFTQLWKYLRDWRSIFQRFDTDKSECITLEEFSVALDAFGYTLSQECVASLFRSGSRPGRQYQQEMSFDMFVQTCINIKTITDIFKAFDTDRDGQITINFEDFLKNVNEFNAPSG